ncbi:N-6 DNA Methylase [Lishizhenia tianjinensis]|uniref:N-6 DNA Methylase n=1 Tax=Lishizhenia tianjinensis TaxID=477690 RepID=A0A1I7AJ90_9FLAO|nr:N-6 DNA methylase [Lishizhenia tianjinensis]SFT74915.1 N-6 DNA Methylase [Lishizhenia tianjinensis]
MPVVNYNERSWAIDVISHINVYLSNRDKRIKGAGGENTIKNNRSSLFPDVLLFGDKNQGEIIQGWELKMPDTAINDSELISNAILKANILKLDSFVLWNVKSAVLYVRSEVDSDDFEILYSWDDIRINNRSEVKDNEQIWKELLDNILETLFSYFESGRIMGRIAAEVLSLTSVIDIILENTDATAQELINGSRSNNILNAQINTWWRSSSNEYPAYTSEDKYKVLAKVVLTDWVIKIVFGHIIKNYFDEAKRIDLIDFNTDVSEAIDLLKEITDSCNFWNIFSINIGQENISTTAWNQIIQLNTFLLELNIAGIDVKILHDILQTSINNAKRRIAGQFSTPVKLAELLARITITDKTKSVLDPCCGTGTIIASAAKIKTEVGIVDDEVINTIWASDKYAFPIQLATLSLSKPENFGKILKIFRKDVIELSVGENINFKDPNNGQNVTIPFTRVGYVISNLPFIQQEDIRHLNPDIAQINNWISNQVETDLSLPGRSDIYTYIPFYLYNILEDEGQIGLILSNAWLGTNYGADFIQLLQYFYELKHIVISANGKWFENADVVTTLLIAEKRVHPSTVLSTSAIGFHRLEESLNSIDDVSAVADDILLKNNSDIVSSVSYTNERILQLKELGLSWSSLFVDLNWILNIQDRFIPVNEIFDIARGERRGWNPMFYPAAGHGIEPDYIRPVLKNLRGAQARGLSCRPNKEAFCCSEDISTLEALNHNGALNWIRSFENLTNTNGRPLTEVLQRTGSRWYEMRAETMADFVANINYDKSLFISRLENRAFVDQRLIRFSLLENKSEAEMILIHALLNSIMSMFFIESLGFGRGLGALDLSKDKIEENFRILSPELLDEESSQAIIDSFQPLLNRERFPLDIELQQEDRVNFERTVFSAFNIEEYMETVTESLTQLFNIRQAVTD